jgi:hypothetical protein
MPTTAKAHFNQDLARAQSIIAQAGPLPTVTAADRLLRDDFLGSAWMFTIGAMDAYFCDAYVAILTKAIRAKSIQANVVLPTFITSIQIPIGSLLAVYANRPNWRWRMAVRRMMQRDNVLSLLTVQKLFNPFFRVGEKFFSNLIDRWIARPNATSRLFGITTAAYLATAGNTRDAARKNATGFLFRRIQGIIQRRHDCIHNCDRPRNTPQVIHSSGTVGNVLRDVKFLVDNADVHIDREFREFLIHIHCTPITRNALGY